ncbi:uncharacterized protein LOC128957097 [Oppia nitens]|uniref:uncharacterized protein LOC128957097 n=1 Tax=Oppia nitens TaxID=1686743 RepID=UPI0023DBE125|nr:uncharacterized protein LOC128957097 [Oppia nitens]
MDIIIMVTVLMDNLIMEAMDISRVIITIHYDGHGGHGGYPPYIHNPQNNNKVNQQGPIDQRQIIHYGGHGGYGGHGSYGGHGGYGGYGGHGGYGGPSVVYHQPVGYVDGVGGGPGYQPQPQPPNYGWYGRRK